MKAIPGKALSFGASTLINAPVAITGAGVAGITGLNGENYGDLSEELSNKLGEQGNDKSLNPFLAQIGMNKTQMTGSKQQFDQLMGGEANKLVTYIASTGKSFKEVMENAAQLKWRTGSGKLLSYRANSLSKDSLLIWFSNNNLWQLADISSARDFFLSE
ncbi:hypothetical protein MUU49_15620 [Scandinavium goeteborgense]|uniref:hypothetical protein n=1 Tax=Scandinavium goeteborgense TaxID=1851514 RepID=UPI002165EC39|nr:hypothetical protein [Scandinavium goeteborgense]MCS2153985.1 hypothetical protein [Scandinavium goeteborgense]